MQVCRCARSCNGDHVAATFLEGLLVGLQLACVSMLEPVAAALRAGAYYHSLPRKF